MQLPTFETLSQCRSILLAGAGGGFDLFSGLPLYHWLKARGKAVQLANLSFSDLRYATAERPTSAMVRITPDSSGMEAYCPEAHLARWLSDRFGDTSIYAFERTGVLPVVEAYRWIVEKHQPDAVVLVDGGTDSLMFGNECGLGTPQEDAASLASVGELNDIPHRFLVCIGFGIDAFHGVCHSHVLENVAALIADDACSGVWSLMKQSAEFAFYREAVDYVIARMPRHPSIVNTSIISSALGWFGNHHPTHRTEGSELYINPLMSLYWSFSLDGVLKKHLYLDRIRSTHTYAELTLAIESFHSSVDRIRPWRDIPC